ncbi:MAG: ABC transporter permease, partial [Oscillospiraceae bacterium]|nr:ABC transporter permease [Oscillospiraceae bacterium]
MKKRWNVYLTVGLILTGLMVFAALLGTFWTPYVPTAMKYGRFQAPSLAHLFGTDNFGRDIFS